MQKKQRRWEEYLEQRRALPLPDRVVLHARAHKLIFTFLPPLTTTALKIIHRMPGVCQVVKDCEPKYQTIGQRQWVLLKPDNYHLTELWIVEGLFDALALRHYKPCLWKQGLPPTTLIQEVLNPLNIHPKIVLAFDNDLQGILHTIKYIAYLLENNIIPQIAILDEYKDINDYIVANNSLPDTYTLQRWIQLLASGHLPPVNHQQNVPVWPTVAPALGELLLAAGRAGYYL